jgi:arylsulfatase A-like enzyme
MSSDARSDDRPPARGRYDRRAFLRRGVRAGGALLGSAAGLDALTSRASAFGSTPAGATAPNGTPPNILVIIVDQMRYPRWFGGTGQVLNFPPNLARLRHGGISFARHHTASNDCTPSRAALLTGLHTHQTGCMITGVSTLAPAFETWGSALRGLGYATYWYGKWHLTRGDRHWNEIDGPPELERYGFDGGTYPSPNGAPVQGLHADPMIANQFVDWYAQAGGDNPWCTTVSFVNPHDIAWWYRWSDINRIETSAPALIHQLPPNFETPEHLRTKPLLQSSLQNTTDLTFGDVPYSGPELLPSWMPFLDLYVKLQLMVDSQIGVVLDTLATRPDVAANTVVLFTADHGEYGASHGLRGKGAGLYEEGINVPLIVNDYRRTATAHPQVVRPQLTSSVDILPLLLTLASGSDEWRDDPYYSHLASRLDLAAILRDPTAPGRYYALHATDEVVTEFALEPYSTIAPIHVVGLITEQAKYGIYSHWRRSTVDLLAAGQENELYDYSTKAGQLEVENRAGSSPLEDGLRATLERAINDELRAPLPPRLLAAQRSGFTDYFKSEQRATEVSLATRRKELEQIGQTELGGAVTQPRHHRPAKKSS